jgi:hypothetical protein
MYTATCRKAGTVDKVGVYDTAAAAVAYSRMLAGYGYTCDIVDDAGNEIDYIEPAAAKHQPGQQESAGRLAADILNILDRRTDISIELAKHPEAQRLSGCGQEKLIRFYCMRASKK